MVKRATKRKKPFAEKPQPWFCVAGLCPGCHQRIVVDNAGGYRQFCAPCVLAFPPAPTEPGDYFMEGEYPEFEWVRDDAEPQTRSGRVTFLKRKIQAAITSAYQKYRYVPPDERPPNVICILSWTAKTPAAVKTDVQLDCAMRLYFEGKVSIALVKRYYKKFIEARKTWWLGAEQQEGPAK